MREKTCSNLIEDGSGDKRAMGTQKCVMKRKLKFEDYKNCLGATQLEIKQNIWKKIKLM